MDWFPITVTTGKAFCNRVSERKMLKEFIKHGRHTVLMAPRRYGKTSLICQVLLELKLPHTIIELTMATSMEEVEKILVQHLSELLHRLLPRTIKAKQKILKLFYWLNPELVLTVSGQKLVFHPKDKKSIGDIAELLKKLDDAAKLANKKVVIVMDEFQQLATITDHNLEASIRHAMQYSKYVSYIFSGSNRNMLISMFNKKNRPLYNACETLALDRIAKEDYIRFINEAAKAKWGKEIALPVLETIFNLSALHPIYVNRICGYFWLKNELPNEKTVTEYWRSFVESQSASFTEELLLLGKNQKVLLSYLATNPTAKISSHEVVTQLGLPEASVRQAAKTLMLKDYLHKTYDGMIQILDPAFKDFILNLN